MKNRVTWGPLLGLLLVIFAVSVGTASAQGFSPSSPARTGVPVQSEVQCGDSAVSLEPYDVQITLLQTVRGKEAWERIKAANASSPAPKAGYDYVLAQIRFELKARISPGNKSFELGRPLQFTAITADGKEYETASVSPPKPELSGKTRAGAAVEGWVVFLVEQKDAKPLMAFDPASGGGTLRGKVLFFQLY